MRLVTISEPAIEPISRDDVKLYLRVDSASEDTTLDRLIAAARGHVEQASGKRLITQTVEVILDAWPSADAADDWDSPVVPYAVAADYVLLPVSPVQSVSSVKTIGATGTETALVEGTDWYLDRSKTRIAPIGGTIWAAPGRAVGGIVITVVAGFGAAAINVPAPLRQAIAMLAAHWFENREAAKPGGLMPSGLMPIPHGVKSILAKYKPLRI